jgi:hypothetical protein
MIAALHAHLPSVYHIRMRIHERSRSRSASDMGFFGATATRVISAAQKSSPLCCDRALMYSNARAAHCTTGKSRMRDMQELPVVPLCRRRAALPGTPNQRHLLRIPPRQEGRIAIVTNVEAGSGGREISQRFRRGRTMFCGRSSHVVLTPRRWCQVRSSLNEACG